MCHSRQAPGTRHHAFRSIHAGAHANASPLCAAEPYPTEWVGRFGSPVRSRTDIWFSPLWGDHSQCCCEHCVQGVGLVLSSLLACSPVGEVAGSPVTLCSIFRGTARPSRSYGAFLQSSWHCRRAPLHTLANTCSFLSWMPSCWGCSGALVYRQENRLSQGDPLVGKQLLNLEGREGWVTGEMRQETSQEFSPNGNQRPGRRFGVRGHPVQPLCASEEPAHMLPGQGAPSLQGSLGTLTLTALRVRRFFLRWGFRFLPDPHQPALTLRTPCPRAASQGSTDTTQPPLNPPLALQPDFRYVKSTVLKGAKCNVGSWGA